jgi:type I restriction enzyme M protein
MSLSTTVKTIQDIMRKDAGVDGDAQRISQLVWMLFLKVFDDAEAERELMEDRYKSPIPERFRWRAWAADAEGITGEALLDFVNNDLFKTLKELTVAGKNATLAGVVRGVFEDAYNYMKSGTLLRQVVNKLNEIDFNKQGDRHEFGDIYEKILSDLQNAGNAGEFYTPRAVTQFMVDQVDPKLGETVLDPACGTGGFLTCTIDTSARSTSRTPRTRKPYSAACSGVEKKPLPHLLCVTNMLFHGIAVPSQIRHDNTLARPCATTAPKTAWMSSSPTRPSAAWKRTASSQLPANLPHPRDRRPVPVLIMHLLKPGDAPPWCLPDGTLFGEGVKTRIKEKLLTECNLHTVVRLPNGVFNPYTGIKTNLLFFDREGPTKTVWFYEHPYPAGAKSYSKTKPLRIDEFAPEKKWWTKRKETDQAWKVTSRKSRNAATTSTSRIPVPWTTAPATAAGKTAAMDVPVVVERALVEGTFTVAKFVESFGVLAEAAGGISRLRGFVLELAIRGRLSSEEELALTENAPFPIPIGWHWTTIGDATVYVQRGKGPEYVETSAVPVVSQKCVQWEGFLIERARFIAPKSLEAYAKERFLVEGDLLWNSTGHGTVGRVAVFHSDARYPRVVADSHVTVIRLANALSRYVWCWLASPTVQSTIDSLVSGTTKQTELATSTVVAHPLPLPPLAEQKRIVARVDQLMALIDQLEAKQNRKREVGARFTKASLEALTTAESPQEFTTAWTRIQSTWPTLLDQPDKVSEVRKAKGAGTIDCGKAISKIDASRSACGRQFRYP